MATTIFQSSKSASTFMASFLVQCKPGAQWNSKFKNNSYGDPR